MDPIKASSAVECFQIVQKRPVGLIILDLLMPGIGGIEALKELEKRRAGLGSKTRQFFDRPQRVKGGRKTGIKMKPKPQTTHPRRREIGGQATVLDRQPMRLSLEPARLKRAKWLPTPIGESPSDTAQTRDYLR